MMGSRHLWALVQLLRVSNGRLGYCHVGISRCAPGVCPKVSMKDPRRITMCARKVMTALVRDRDSACQCKRRVGSTPRMHLGQCASTTSQQLRACRRMKGRTKAGSTLYASSTRSAIFSSGRMSRRGSRSRRRQRRRCRQAPPRSCRLRRLVFARSRARRSNVGTGGRTMPGGSSLVPRTEMKGVGTSRGRMSH